MPAKTYATDRTPSLRCPYCRDGVREGVRCPGCPTRYHVACANDLLVCAVQGCSGRLRRAKPRWALIGMTVVALASLAGSLVLPNLQAARRHQNEVLAIGTLKTLAHAQTRFRESDQDNNKRLDYGTLEQLVETSMLSEEFKTGRRGGYVFTCSPDPEHPEFCWEAIAVPEALGVTGDTVFLLTQEGVIHHVSGADALAILLRAEAQVPRPLTPEPGGPDRAPALRAQLVRSLRASR